ncbi:MAG: hypothetical protein LBU88_04380 [Treponema sp.]|nr:hypothetical protein [Treponema sp.]
MNTVKKEKTDLPTIGTRNESSLHRTLKFQYAGPGGKTEEMVGNFVADGVRKDGEYIEVQTSNFGSLCKKIKAIIQKNKKAKIRIIHPIAVNKYIEVYAPVSSKRGSAKKTAAAVPLWRRKSPKKGSLWSLFDALVQAPELAMIPGVTIEAVLADITEIRVKDGKGSWRRKGISIKDRILSAWHENIIFAKPKDYLRFIPYKKGEEFTTTTFAARTAINTDTARMALYVLTKIGVVERIGKQGRSWVYAR